MPAFLAPAIISGISALGGLLANRRQRQKQQQRTTGTTRGTQVIDETTFQRPDLDPETQSYLDLLRQRYTDLINRDIDLSGFESTGIQNINRAGDIRQKALSNILAARGLSYSPVAAGALTGAEGARISDVVNFQNQIPLLREQTMQDRLNQAAGFFSRIPIGQSTTTTGTRTGEEFTDTTGTGTLDIPGNRLGGLFGGLGSVLAYLYGQGAFSRNPVYTNTTNIARTPVFRGIIRNPFERG